MEFRDIQRYPTSDSPNNDAFEALVEAYYQQMGYITSAGKWFWVWEEGKKQKGYQDIDVLAIDGDTTTIVSVSTNLDDKVNLSEKTGGEKLAKLKNHFQRVEDYLRATPEYKWLVTKSIKKLVAYQVGPKSQSRLDETIGVLMQEKILTISARQIMTELKNKLKAGFEDKNQPLKLQDPILRAFQIDLHDRTK